MSAFFTFSLSATVWPQMSKMLTPESGVQIVEIVERREWRESGDLCNNRTDHHASFREMSGTRAGVEKLYFLLVTERIKFGLRVIDKSSYFKLSVEN